MTDDTCPECGLRLCLRPFIAESRCQECSQEMAREAYYRAVDEMYATMDQPEFNQPFICDTEIPF